MLVQQLVRTDPEKVLINVQNVDASSLTTGFAVALNVGDAAAVVSTDGIQALLLGTNANVQPAFIGVAYKDIAANAYGLVQCWGYAASVALSGVGTSLTIGVLTGATNTLLQLGARAGTLFSTLKPEAISTYCGKYIINALTTGVSANPAYTSGFVRCL